MEISATGRLVVRITAADVGKRVSVRSMIEHAPSGEKFTDTIGVLTSWDNGVLLITRKGGESVRIPESSLVAGKIVPSAPARRRGPAASYEELAHVASRAWRPVESERLGEWELRAAGGFTRRANSVLPIGDPGMPLDDALTVVRRWYGDRGLPAYIQTATGAEGTQELLCAELEARGWVREVTAELWIGALAPVADREAPGVVLSREADEAWLSRYQRKGVSEVALKVLGSGPSVWFATVPGAEGEAPAAIGRCVVDGRWAGFAAVEVDPAYRRQGLATTVMSALAARALTEGASAAWLQVEADNAGARSLYAGMGFGPHHAYHHYRAPEAAGGGGSPRAGQASEGGGSPQVGQASEGGGSARAGQAPGTGGSPQGRHPSGDGPSAQTGQAPATSSSPQGRHTSGDGPSAQTRQTPGTSGSPNRLQASQGGPSAQTGQTPGAVGSAQAGWGAGGGGSRRVSQRSGGDRYRSV